MIRPRLIQAKNEYSPTFLTLLPIVMLVSFPQSRDASASDALNGFRNSVVTKSSSGALNESAGALVEQDTVDAAKH